MPKRRPRVVVVGAGVAGLAAAWRLARAGCEVNVLERGPSPGGRAGSIFDEIAGESLDTGQHIFMGAYRLTRSWLRALGTLSRVKFQERLALEYLKPGGELVEIQGSQLPAPLHLMSAVSGLEGLSGVEKVRTVGLLNVLVPGAGPDDLTVSGWMEKNNVPHPVRDRVLEPLCFAALNEYPNVASALPMVSVLRTILMAGPGGSGLGLAKVALADLYAKGALAAVKASGGELITGAVAESLYVDESGHAAGVGFGGGRDLEADAVICAVAPWDLVPMLRGITRLSPLLVAADAFNPSPILAVHLWLDRTVLDREFIGFLDGRFHWAFNRTALLGAGKLGGQHLCLVRSAARDLLASRPDDLVRRALEELGEYIADARRAKLIHSRVIWETKATVSFVPGTDPLRPPTATDVEGLAVAGDWVQTGLPCTIESAVLSGMSAARQVLSWV